MDDRTRAVAVYRLISLFQGAIAQAGGLPPAVLAALLVACEEAALAAYRATGDNPGALAVPPEATTLARKWMGMEG